MEWIRDLIEAGNERRQVDQLRWEMADLDKAYSEERRHPMPCLCEDCRQVAAKYYHERATASATISQIETHRAIIRAGRWQVPLPSKPTSTDEDNEFWHWDSMHREFYLTDAGIAHLRREVFLERDLRTKPWLSWAAIAISLVSLIVVIFKS